MQRIIAHIERLLTIHDCVVVPQLGGFVAQKIPAVYILKEHGFKPPHSEISFNASLTHSDGLLATSYIQAYKVSFKKAQLMIEEDVDEIKKSLNSYKKASLGVIGSLHSGESGQLIFSPGKTASVDALHYGLPTFYFPVLPQSTMVDESVKRANDSDVFYVPIHRKFIRGVAATAAALGLFLLLSTPVKEINNSAYTASFIPTERSILSPADNTANHTIADSESNNIPTVAEATVNTSAPQSTLKPKLYYIIIGSFPNEQQANLFIADVDQTIFRDVNTVVRDNKHRVYTQAFDNREEAETYLATVRQNEKYQTAWLFISR
ncbi:SPOR domain-containing protein [Parabacteroides sp. OttesenSCG-928-G07]|nr:SPOR domain-containing protein [Parabacteroides sp. OttesenSCG-928-G21]MDL2277945.1 SPOR domain-containing protein [Parabacteroides sp. OttesenSCG-928-G07]